MEKAKTETTTIKEYEIMIAAQARLWFFITLQTWRELGVSKRCSHISDYYHYIRFTHSPKNLGFFDSRVRFFAAAVQFVKKEELKEKEPGRPWINDEIGAEVVRLVTDEGHTVVSRREALQRASELKLDLVESRHGIIGHLIDRCADLDKPTRKYTCFAVH